MVAAFEVCKSIGSFYVIGGGDEFIALVIHLLALYKSARSFAELDYDNICHCVFILVTLVGYKRNLTASRLFG